jgi:hypothetical protein
MSKHTIETAVDIAAPVERVWRALTDFASYPQWSRFILSIKGEARESASLSVRMDDGGGAMVVSPEIIVCEAPTELRWRGVLGVRFLFSAEHYFHLEPLGGGGTRLGHGEKFGGLLVPLFWKRFDTRMRHAFQEFNAAIRTRAENSEQ